VSRQGAAWKIPSSGDQMDDTIIGDRMNYILLGDWMDDTFTSGQDGYYLRWETKWVDKEAASDRGAGRSRDVYVAEQRHE